MANKKILKTLRQVNSKLPPISQPAKMKILGSEIIKHNPNATDSDGNQINADKVYSCDATVRKNHYRAMKKILKKGGVDEVNKYIKEIISFEEGRRKLINDTMGGLQNRVNSITTGF